jgi:hypothetical protein
MSEATGGVDAHSAALFLLTSCAGAAPLPWLYPRRARRHVAALRAADEATGGADAPAQEVATA